jgi:enoyl-CoA hydratase/carnithine racemase
MIVAEGLREHTRDDSALAWTLDHPARRNAITPDALRFLADRCARLRGETVVLGATGPGFCAGFDLSALEAAVRASTDALPDATLIAAVDAMQCADATFVAALHGYVIGAGVELSTACDLRLASDDTTFRVPAAELGVVYHAVGLARLRAAFGPAGARRLVLLGERLDAATALAAGAIHRVVAPEALAGAVDEVVAHLSAVDARSLGANRDLLRALDRPALAGETRQRHERARIDAYARLTRRG